MSEKTFLMHTMWHHPLCVMTLSELAVIMSQTSTSRLLRTGVPQIHYLFFHTHHCWLEISSHHHHWGYHEPDEDGEMLPDWASGNDNHLIHDSKQRGTFHSARWKRDYSPDLCLVSTVNGRPQPASCTVLEDFPHSQHRPSVIHVGLRLPVMRGINKRRWNFRKADWPKYTAATERSIPLIPVSSILIEESYRRFTGAITMTHFSISRGFRPRYIPCLNEECQVLLDQLEETGDTEVDRVIGCCSMPSLGRDNRADDSLQSQVARAGHSSDVLEPLKTHQEQAILRRKLTLSLVTCFR